MTIQTAETLDKVTWSFGPIGMAVRQHIHNIASIYGVALEEDRGTLSSMYRANGNSTAIEHFRTDLAKTSEELAQCNHASFVDDMERSEKRRAFWGILVGRTTRRNELDREELTGIAMLLVDVQMSMACKGDVARRLARSLMSLRLALRLQEATNWEITTIAAMHASMAMRQLQHDVRRKNVVLPDSLKKRVMAIVPTIETW